MMNAETWRSLKKKDQVSWDQISEKGKSTILNYAKQQSSNLNNDGSWFKPRYGNKSESNIHAFKADVHEFMVDDNSPGTIMDNSDGNQVDVEISTHHFETTDNISTKTKKKTKKTVTLEKGGSLKQDGIPSQPTMLLQAATFQLNQ